MAAVVKVVAHCSMNRVNNVLHEHNLGDNLVMCQTCYHISQAWSGPITTGHWLSVLRKDTLLHLPHSTQV